MKLHYRADENEKILYYDVTSLYPWVNRYGEYPVGHPEIIVADFKDLKHYFGIAKIKILPPRSLYHPVLPLKINDKLTFALCRKCADRQSQDNCVCSDEDRCIIGTWCTPEIQKARDLGYKVVKVYEIYQWHQTTRYDPISDKGGLFGNYISLFLKMKQEASGRPAWVKTEGDLTNYIENYFQKEKIALKRENITINKALRSIAKLFLNSLWGKFGERTNLPQTEFFCESEADKFFQCLSNPSREIKDFHIISEKMIQVSWESKRGMIKEDNKTNLFAATFTTCWARLKLYSYLELLGRRVLYYDTDSVIFTSTTGSTDPPLGDYLGDLTSELNTGDHIVEFVSGGPKQYAFKTLKGEQVCKIRGFSLNCANSQILNFQSLLQIVKSPDAADNTNSKTIVLENPRKITRTKYLRKIYNRSEDRTYKIVYSKRVIQKNSFDTLPYGY